MRILKDLFLIILYSLTEYTQNGNKNNIQISFYNKSLLNNLSKYKRIDCIKHMFKINIDKRIGNKITVNIIIIDNKIIEIICI